MYTGKAYIIITHVYKTVQKGEHKGKIQTHETCEFVDRYKPRHISTATFIMDAHKREFVKNTYRQEGLDYDTIEEHIIKGYADKYRRFLEIVEAEIPEALLLSKEEVDEQLQTQKQEETE